MGLKYEPSSDPEPQIQLGHFGDALRDASTCVAARPSWPKGHARKAAALQVFYHYIHTVYIHSKEDELVPQTEAVNFRIVCKTDDAGTCLAVHPSWPKGNTSKAAALQFLAPKLTDMYSCQLYNSPLSNVRVLAPFLDERFWSSSPKLTSLYRKPRLST